MKLTTGSKASSPKAAPMPTKETKRTVATTRAAPSPAIGKITPMAGISSANLVEFRQRYDISDIFRLFGQSESRVVKLDLGVEGPKLQVGQLYFLSPTLAH